MNCTIKIRTNSVGDIAVTGKVEKLADVQKLFAKGAKYIKAVSRILPEAMNGKVEAISVGK